MDLGIGELEKSNDKWVIVYPDGFVHDLENAVRYSEVFIDHEGWWEEVYCGEVEHLLGEIHGEGYEGLAVCVSGTRIVIPVQDATPGKWVAISVYRKDEYWELESGMKVRTPETGGFYAAGSFPLAPKGRVVCTIVWGKGVDGINLGRVGFDLAQMPFPKEMWFYRDQAYQTSELDLKWDFDAIELTAAFFGGLDMHTLFWLT